MIANLQAVLLVACLGGAAIALPAPRACVVVEEKVLKALDAWLKAYRAGKIDFNDRDDVFKQSIANKHGVLPKGLVGKLTYRRELEALLDQAAKLDTAEAAEKLLEVAAIGLDGAKYTFQMAPGLVRDMGEQYVARLQSAPAREHLLQAARGETRVEKQRASAVRAAALRALGTIADPAYRPTLEENLGHADVPVRHAAADGLQRMPDESSALALVKALERESSDFAIEAQVRALRACYAKYVKTGKADAATPAKGDKEGAGKDAEGGKEEAGKEDAAAKEGLAAKESEAKELVLPESSRLAIRAAIQALGRTTWRADLTLVSFLDDFRSLETVPALIEVLQRFKDRPEDVLSGKLSGLLLHRVHETLVSMTGAVIPADQPARWRELWEKEQGAMVIAKKKDASVQEAGTVSGGLFGIPVQGSRVVFIVDLSRSMTFAMPTKTGTGNPPDEVPSRLDVAKRELRRAIDGMSELSSFNCITFNGDPKAEIWSKDLVQATAKNKERFRTYVDKMVADGGTNLWAGLEEGLKMKSQVYGERYASNLDEVFVVSDGAPSVGEIVDPVEILRLVTETNRFSRVRINTIFITSPNDENPRNQAIPPDELMKRMAEQNGGRFVHL